jgi:hypothetical protein
VSQFTGDCIDSGNTAEGAVPAIGPQGQVYTAWSLNDTIWFDRSTDGGQIWLAQDIFVTTQPGGWNFNVPGLNRCNGLPVTACDRNSGAIYVNWTDQRNGENDTDVFLVKSLDGGNTWSAPARVNDDPPGRHNFLSWMAIDQTSGILFFVFYDRRDYSDWQTGVYLAYSTDGGSTFANLKISTLPFTPQPGKFFGDYTNITAHDGHVHPIWERQVDGATSIWTAVLDYPVGIESPDFFALKTELKTLPNPFFESATITFNTAIQQQLSLSVSDLTGRSLGQIFTQKKFPPGAHEVRFDNAVLQLQPGMYFLELSNGWAFETCKVVVR